MPRKLRRQEQFDFDSLYTGPVDDAYVEMGVEKSWSRGKRIAERLMAVVDNEPAHVRAAIKERNFYSTNMIVEQRRIIIEYRAELAERAKNESS